MASNVSTYLFSSLDEGKYYTFRVRSASSAESSDWLTSSKILMFGPATVSDVGNGGINISGYPCTDDHLGKTYATINFTAASEASRFDIYQVSGSSRILLDSLAAGSSSKTIQGIDANTAHNILVKAIGSDGTESLNESTTDFTSGKFVYCNVIGGSTLRANLQDRLNQPRNMFIYSNKLFVTDSSHNRILIWNSLPTSSSDLPDVVVGQIDFSGARANGEGGTRQASGLNGPNGIWAGMIGGQEKLLVTDTNNHRVLVFDGIPSSNFPQASVVLGQVDAFAGASTCDSSTFKNPYGVYSDGTKIYVADTVHNRIAIYNSLPAVSGVAADLVLGQGNKTSCGTGNTASNLNGPRDVWSDGSKIMVTDYGNHRILVWNTFPSSDGDPADAVLGQASLTGNGASNGANGLSSPSTLTYDGSRVYVADSSNHRLMIFSGIPGAGTYGPNATVSIGRNTSGVGALGPNQSSLYTPRGVAVSSGGVIYVSENSTDRIIAHNTLPGVDTENHDFYLMTGGWFQHGQASQSLFHEVSAVEIDSSGRVYVADQSNNRVLVFNEIPTSPSANADYVLGHSNFTPSTDSFPINEYIVRRPSGMCLVNGQLYIMEAGFQRATVRDIPISGNNTAAVAVLGQTSFNTSTSGSTLDKFNGANKCYSDGTRLWVSMVSTDNVYQWDTLPAMANASDNPAADYNLGLGSATNGDTGFENPYSIVMHGGRLFVADPNNTRVKGFNGVPSSTAPSYDFIFGVSDSGSTTNTRLGSPRGLASNGSDKLYVAEYSNHRISVYKNIDGSNTPLIDSVIGQVNFTTGNPNDSSSSIGFYEPEDIRYHQGRLIIADRSNGRVLIIPAP
mgnify:FL=1